MKLEELKAITSHAEEWATGTDRALVEVRIAALKKHIADCSKNGADQDCALDAKAELAGLEKACSSSSVRRSSKPLSKTVGQRKTYLLAGLQKHPKWNEVRKSPVNHETFATLIDQLYDELWRQKQELNACRQELAAIRQKGFTWRGTYKRDELYEIGDVTTWSGAMWSAKVAAPKSKPGNGNSEWQLCVMRGAAAASPYQIAIRHGFKGTEREWVESLVRPAAA
jgi:hypothetical protein